MSSHLEVVSVYFPVICRSADFGTTSAWRPCCRRPRAGLTLSGRVPASSGRELAQEITGRDDTTGKLNVDHLERVPLLRQPCPQRAAGESPVRPDSWAQLCRCRRTERAARPA